MGRLKYLQEPQRIHSFAVPFIVEFTQTCDLRGYLFFGSGFLWSGLCVRAEAPSDLVSPGVSFSPRIALLAIVPMRLPVFSFFAISITSLWRLLDQSPQATPIIRNFRTGGRLATTFRVFPISLLEAHFVHESVVWPTQLPAVMMGLNFVW
jgi:hypothetical protein